VPARRPRLLLALCAIAAVLPGCGSGSASDATGSVPVTVTRDFGADPVASAPPVGVQGTTKLTDVVGQVAKGLVSGLSYRSVDGVVGDWRLFVNGVEVENPATAEVRPGDRVWLDLVPDGTPPVPSVVGAYPEPFVHGTGGKRIPTRVECADPESAACSAVATRLSDLGIVAARGGIGAGTNDESVRVLVGTWAELRETRSEPVLNVDEGPSASGVFARFGADGRELEVLDASGEVARTLEGSAGLVATTRIEERQPVWLVSGTDDAGVDAAAALLDEATLTTKYALAVQDDRGIDVPSR
jgi:hypothetical protein